MGEEKRLQGILSLTPNILINTAMTIMPSPSGNVRVRHICKPRFSLQGGVRLAFTEHFSYRKGEGGESISTAELVAEFRTSTRALDIAALEKDLGRL
jgi:hypothetical protein